jgi:hypothetical protein
MKRCLVALALLLPVSLAGGADLPSAYSNLWKEVDAAIEKGLPKTALEKLAPIEQAATRDKADAEAIRAICTRIAIEGNIEGNKPEEKVVRLRAAISNAPAAMQPMLDAILANWYWHYYRQNRWRFVQRTRTAEAPSGDFTTWDLPRVLAAIAAQFQRALAAEKVLQATPIAAYDALLEKGSMPDACRPTLYDFVAHNAIAFYSLDEQAGARAEDNFVLQPDSPVFGTAEEFLAWNIESTDDASPTVKALKLYQAAMSFHRRDANPDAWLDADLLRIQFGHRAAAGEGKTARAEAALRRYAEEHAAHAFSARARAAWARLVRDEDKDPAAARAIAARGLADFPSSLGGALCFNLIREVEARSVSLGVERVWNACKPELNVAYRNLTNVHFRAFAADFDARMNRAKNVWQSPANLDADEAKAMLRGKPEMRWSAELPPTTNYLERTERLVPPPGLKPGFYFLFASASPDFGEADNEVSYASFWVSDLALIVRPRSRDTAMEGLVLDAASGEPIADAKVGGWAQSGDKRTALAPVATDGNGWFRFEGLDNRSCLLLVTHKGQSLAMDQNQWLYRGGKPSWPQSHTVFFTDRSLYRPGQTIRYKGICIRYDQPQADYRVLADASVAVVFQDPNGKEIARQAHRVNEFGSFDGSFTAPRDRASGRMSVRVDGEPRGSGWFNVEEYKRPKFQVKLDAPKEAARLNAEVAVTGRATAYTGVPLGGARVRYRVVREMRFPVWWRWSRWAGCFWAQQPAQEIGHGVAQTGEDGSFTVRFLARPPADASPTSGVSFAFTVNADVTDSTGETRSGEKDVVLGFAALEAALTADEWQTVGTPAAVTVSTRSLDGEPRPARGTVKIHRLLQPEQVVRGPLAAPYHYWRTQPWAVNARAAPAPDLSDPNNWESGDVAAETAFETGTNGTVALSFQLDTGAYRALLTTKDAFGREVTARLPLMVTDEGASRFTVRVPNRVAAQRWSVLPGETFRVLWGSGYDQARAFIELECQDRTLKRFWTGPGRTQEIVPLLVEEAQRGGFVVRVTCVRENRAYLENRIVEVPWSNKVLHVRWEHFVSKLAPGRPETWTAVVSGPGAAKAGAEVVASLYDASLDAYLPQDWPAMFGVFRHESDDCRPDFVNDLAGFSHFLGSWRSDVREADESYRELPPEIAYNLAGYQYFGRGKPGRLYGNRRAFMLQGNGMALGGMLREAAAMDAVACAPSPAARPAERMLARTEDRKAAGEDKAGAGGGAGKKQADEGGGAPAGALDQVAARKNLAETAFFFPRLTADEKGAVRMEFTMPEALTEWKLLAFAHDKDLRAGLLQDKAVTAKDLMVEPNPPRFVREGDQIEFTVKVSNRSAEKLAGAVRLTLADAATLKDQSTECGMRNAEQEMKLAPMESKTFAWRLSIPDGMGFLTYKAVAAAGRLADGEEGPLPVLSRRILVTETLCLPVRGRQTKEFRFDRLLDARKSDTLRHQSLTAQMVSQPAWYAVMALPYIMDRDLDCSEAVFNRLYANALARHIAGSDPKIRRVFDLWRETPALDSPLEKNQELKAVMLEETPWYRQAQDEKQARRNVGVLFDDNRLDDEQRRSQSKLAQMQYGDGRWPWFPGGRPNDYMTLYIATGHGRLRHLGVKADMAPAIKAWGALDNWVDETYREILRRPKPEKPPKEEPVYITPTIAYYLYGRSFFLDDAKIAAKPREAVDFFLAQGRKHWLKVECRQSQAHLALAFQRFGDGATAKAILDSIRERSVSNEELGMFWRDLELSWGWFRAPIETQALMIEAFDEIAHDAAAVEACKVWLLKQKQTQGWKTTRATADAVYGLLLRGAGLLASDALVEVKLDDRWLRPEKTEAGTGFYEQRFAPAEIRPAMGRVTVKKVDDGVSWGSLHWQYLEDMTKVTPYAGTPLTVRKTLFLREYTKKGPTLRPAKGDLAVGDELVVRVELRTDRDMEYVHLKDQRGAGTEPVNVLSRYRYQDGLAYYESTRDTASHFYIEYLPKGAYVFEYAARIVHRGRYQTGIAEAQCLYAPEFNSHSGSFDLRVK